MSLDKDLDELDGDIIVFQNETLYPKMITVNCPLRRNTSGTSTTVSM